MSLVCPVTFLMNATDIASSAQHVADVLLKQCPVNVLALLGVCPRSIAIFCPIFAAVFFPI